MDMLNIMECLGCLGDVKIEGIDSLFVRFQGIVATYKKKNYDILDHRKGEVRRKIMLTFANTLYPSQKLNLMLQYVATMYISVCEILYIYKFIL